METIVVEKSQEIKNLKSKILKWTLICFMLFILGGIFANSTNFKYSLPLGTLFMYLALFLPSIYFIVSIFKKNDGLKSFRKILVIIVFGFIGFFTGFKVLGATYDLITGPKKIILEDAEIVLKRRRSRYSYTYLKYLKGETEDGYTKEIFIRGKDRQEYVEEILDDSDEVIVYYFKGINEIYDIEEY